MAANAPQAPAPARTLFGTDGVRGAVGDKITARLALELGQAATRGARDTGTERPQVLIIRDTRESGSMLEAALAAGVAAAGGDALLGGVLPTPAAPLLLRRYDFQLAAVISASHNPYADNGIKFFGAGAHKLSDEQEAAVEAAMRDPGPAPERPGRVRELHGTFDDYLRELHLRFQDLDLSGLDVLTRLRQRRRPPGGAGDLPPPGGEGHHPGHRARRAQHQPRLRFHPRRAAGRRGGGGRPRRRLCLRRRRRPRAGG